MALFARLARVILASSFLTLTVPVVRIALEQVFLPSAPARHDVSMTSMYIVRADERPLILARVVRFF
jgi:hypothetical protein